MTFSDDVPEAKRIALSDAQTSGGLLIAVAPERADSLRQALEEQAGFAAQIGTVAVGEGLEVV
ncbi:MAG: hypothetical protein JO193_04770 [Candidatus Eremiobacteraeota bacterium]|nr:hypothetical protein [Candidatus Eremiobacteraeota bacterium]